MYLVKLEFDYADEFDVYGFQVLSDKEWQDMQEAIKRTEYPQDFYFGTNEEIIIESAEELLRGIKAFEITESEAEVLKKFFAPPYEGSSTSFGWTGILDSIMERLSDEDYVDITGEEI